MDQNLIKTEGFIMKWALFSIFLALLLPWFKPEWVEINHIGIAGHTLQYHVLHWLFPFFFLHVILEAKKEIIDPDNGTLYGRKAIVPVLLAIAGIVGPMLIKGLISGDFSLKSGILIPTATDIAFVIIAMQLAGLKAKHAIYIYILSLAVVDDIVGIIFISLLEPVSTFALIAYIVSIVLVLLAHVYEDLLDKYCRDPMIWFILVIIFTIVFYNLHIHTTLAGVFVGLMVPYRPAAERIKNGANKRTSIYYVLEHDILKDLVGIVIVPAFIMTSLAINWRNLHLTDLMELKAIAVFCGLIFGKSIFIFSAAFIATKVKVLEFRVDLVRFFFASILCGIGLTVSLFFVQLSDVPKDATTVAVLLASAICFAVGITGLRLTNNRTQIYS